MAYVNPHILDNGLAALTSGANRLDLCSQEPTTYTQATSTYSRANKTSLSVASVSDRTPSGRKVTVNAITGGTVTSTGDVTHWAVVDTANSRLLATGPLSATASLTSGNQFTLTAFDIGIPGAA